MCTFYHSKEKRNQTKNLFLHLCEKLREQCYWADKYWKNSLPSIHALVCSTLLTVSTENCACRGCVFNRTIVRSKEERIRYSSCHRLGMCLYELCLFPWLWVFHLICKDLSNQIGHNLTFKIFYYLYVEVQRTK